MLLLLLSSFRVFFSGSSSSPPPPSQKPTFQIPIGAVKSGQKEPPHGISTGKFQFFHLNRYFEHQTFII